MMTNPAQRLYTKDDLYAIVGCLEGTENLLKSYIPMLDDDVYEDMHKYATWLNDMADGMSDNDFIVCDDFSTTMEHGV